VNLACQKQMRTICSRVPLFCCGEKSGSAYFNHPGTFLQRRDDSGQGAAEGGEEGLLATVAEAHPDEGAGGSGAISKMEEVLIFADQSAALGNGVVPNVRIVGLVHLQVEDVLCIMSA